MMKHCEACHPLFHYNTCGDVMNGIIYKNSSVSDYTNIAERI